MGLFAQSSPFDADIEKATSEKNTSEPWGVIIDICDKVGTNSRNAKDCLKAIMRRMGHNDPHVVIQAITLLDACVNNCGKNFHLEVASRDFENEFTRLLSKAQPQVATKMRLLLKKWAENDFKADPQLNLIPSLYQRLKSEGHDFTDAQKASKSAIPAAVIKDPNVVTSQQEEDDIAKAIELSLKEAKDSPKKLQTTSSSSPYPSLYPWLGGTAPPGATASAIPQSEPRKVRALYDFEAAEDNELTFVAGDIIHVLDDSDPNWWKGYNQRGEGLFPSNFVTADLSVEPERLDLNSKSNKTDDDAKQGEKTDSKLEEDKDYVPEINEEKIDRLLHLLHEANPEDSSQDSEEMLRLEIEVNKMGPLIDAELERVDRKHAQLTQLSSDLVDAINLYHTLMREPDRTAMAPTSGAIPGPMGYMPSNFNPQHSAYAHNSMYAMPPNMYHPGAMPTTALPNSMPSMPPMMHMMPGPGQQQQASASQPPQMNQQMQQMAIMGNSVNHGAFPNQQMIPVQYQNGHPPHQQPPVPMQNQHPISPPPQQQQMHNSIPVTSMQSTTSPPSANPQLMQQPQQQQPPSNINQPPVSAFHPVPQTSMGGVYSQQPNSFVPIHSAGNYAMQPHPGMLQNNSMLGNMMPAQQQQHQPPQSMPQISHNAQMQMVHQMSAINQPITHSLLGQNDSKTNIPIYQQQR